MAIARFLDCIRLALRASGLWLQYAPLQNLIPSLPSTLAQSKERKGSIFAIWQHSRDSLEEIVNVDDTAITVLEEEGSSRDLTPDGGIFSGASEASNASNDCEFEFMRRTVVVPLSGMEYELFCACAGLLGPP